MHVDRQRFILLASAIATGCGGGEVIPTEISVATPRELEGGVEQEPAAEIPAEPETPLPSSGSDAAALRAELTKRCETLQQPSGPFCEGFDDLVDVVCPQFADMLEPAAARRAVSCLTERSGTIALCGHKAAESCFLAGVSMGSATRESSQLCREVMGRCRRSRWRGADLDESSCQRAVGAVRSDKVDDFVACMSESCEIQGCVFSLTE